MTRPQLLIAILLTLTTKLMAQAPNPIKGILLDSLHQPIEGATVFLKTSPSDSIILLTTPTGSFTIPFLKADTLDIRINRMGFYPFSARIPANTLSTPSYTIILKSRNTLLKEIVIHSTPTLVQIKGDTMQYNMDGVLLKPNSVAEDILKILPGLLVDQDGNVFYKGKKISAIKINGKNIAVNDIKDITKLFPADAIKSIQLINEFTPLDRITGRKIDPSTNVLNIQTKEKKGIIFSALAGGGTSERYSINSILNVMSGPSATTLSINSNNTFPTFNLTATNANLNYATTLKSGLALDAGVFTAITNSTNKSNSLTTTQSDRGTLQTEDISNQQNSIKSITFLTNGEKLVNSLPVIAYSASYARQHSNNQDELLSTQTGFQHQINETTRNNEMDNQNLNGSLLLSHTSKNGNIILSNQLAAGTVNNDNQLNEKNNIQYYDQDNYLGDSLIQRKTIKKGMRTSISEISSFVYKFSPASSFELRYQLLIGGCSLQSNSFNLDSTTKATEIDSLTVNNKLNSTQHKIGLNYKYSWKKANLLFGAKLISDALSLNINSNNMLKRAYPFILPEARLELNPINTRSLVIAYTSDLTDPGADQLNPIGDYSSPQNPIIGNINLKPSQTHEFSVNYTSIGKYDIALYGSFIYYLDNIVSKVDWTPNVYNNLIQVTTFTNVNGAYGLRSHASVARRFNDNKWGVAVYGGASYNHAITYIDGTKTINHSYQADPSFRINYASKLLEIQPSITYAAIISSYEGFAGLHTFTSNITSRLDAKLSLKNWLLSIQAVKRFNYGFAQAYQTNPFNCNTFLEYRFAKDRLTIKGSAINIFNQMQNNNQSVSTTSVIQTNQINRGRFFLLSLQVKLTNNKQ